MTLLKGTRVTWLGHATVLVETAGRVNFLIDPFLEHNPKFPKDFKLPEKIDYVLLTHAHIDHTADAIPVAQKHGSTLVAIYELAGYMAAQGVKSTVGMNLGGSVTLSGVRVSMVEAKHSSSLDVDGVSRYLGVAAGLVLSIPDGPVLYHAGDTAVFRDMELIRELYSPEVAMLPIGGCFTMGPKEAALAAKYLQPKLILPIHWGTMPQLTGTPQELASLLGDDKLVAMVAPGEALAS
jgi:L-ascorbate metabolism protein UlaG (beta-lactamase superfamily)